MTKIKATCISGRGKAECFHCSANPELVELVYTYKNIPDLEQAEIQLYKDFFQDEMNIQNEKYIKKGNYGRVWTLDEWRQSVRHRPLATFFKIGNQDAFLHTENLLNAYKNFSDWREESIGDNIAIISAVMFTGDVPHIHEKYVLFWTDDDGIRHVGIDKTLEKIGIRLPFKAQREGRYNNRKMVYDRNCREGWLDLADYEIERYSDVELERPERYFKHKFKLTRDLKLLADNREALLAASRRYRGKVYNLEKKIADMEKEQDEINDKIKNDILVTAAELAELKTRSKILKGKIKDYKAKKEKAEKKYKEIEASI